MVFAARQRLDCRAHNPCDSASVINAYMKFNHSSIINSLFHRSQLMRAADRHKRDGICLYIIFAFSREPRTCCWTVVASCDSVASIAFLYKNIFLKGYSDHVFKGIVQPKMQKLIICCSKSLWLLYLNTKHKMSIGSNGVLGPTDFKSMNKNIL